MKVTDPVCGQTVDLTEATDPVVIEHEGWAYFFCSIACRDRFLTKPEGHARAPRRTGSAGRRADRGRSADRDRYP